MRGGRESSLIKINSTIRRASLNQSFGTQKRWGGNKDSNGSSGNDSSFNTYRENNNRLLRNELRPASII